MEVANANVKTRISRDPHPSRPITLPASAPNRRPPTSNPAHPAIDVLPGLHAGPMVGHITRSRPTPLMRPFSPNPLTRRPLAAFLAACLAALLPFLPSPTLAAPANPWLQRLGTTRGLCVLLGDTTTNNNTTTLALALELARTTELLVYTQFPDPATVETARRRAEAQGLYGRRLFIDQGPSHRLPLADNLADAILVLEPSAAPPESEALRVLRPGGRAWFGERALTKLPPEGTDVWSHPYHGPDNNPASNDRVAKGPYLTQFLAEPRYAPLPQAAVAAGGRVFKLFGHIAFKEREEPWLNTLAAFNGYNGAFLWRREIPAGINVHRNTFIATADAVYYADDTSCKVLDAATGALRDEIAPPESLTGGTFWKWMALDSGLLYASVGEQEQRDPIIRMKSDRHGWPWDPLSPAFNQPEHPWGFGRTLLAIDPETKSIRWRHQENEPFDGRATCVRNQRIFLFRHGAYLACLDAQTGKELWRRTPQNAPALFEALGPALPRQDWRTNWRTTAYTRASDQALYLAGPTLNRTLAVSATDGQLLWQHPYNNYQLVLQGDALWALSGQIDAHPSRKFDPLTGRVLQELNLARRACARPTGAMDAIFCRANDGSTRLDITKTQPQLVSPMRAQCQDGVTVAHGLLYWWPSTCDCNLSLYGITCLGPAGDFRFDSPPNHPDRLHLDVEPTQLQLSPQDTSGPAYDWPTFRADNTASTTTDATLPNRSRRLWQSTPNTELTPTAPTLADNRVFVAGSDGVVRAFDASTGTPLWMAFTGGAIRYSPTLWQGRVYVGSGDGWVYCFRAHDGIRLWRFQAAPVERRIPIYGQLGSTWPAASGVIIHQGLAYVAAGIVNYDGTHVYALDAVTGQPKWQNHTSGHLDPDSLAGVSVQGHMIVHENKLWLAGGNVVSPGQFDLATGRCLNDVDLVHRMSAGNLPASEAPRGSSLFVLPGQVRVSDQPLYAHPQWKVYDASVLNKTWLGSVGDRDITWVNNARIVAYPRVEDKRAERFQAGWGKNRVPGLDPAWDIESKDSTAVALARNAIAVGRPSELAAFSVRDGKPLWSHTLPGVPVSWGLAVDRHGRVFVSLEGGQVVCFGNPDSSQRASLP